MSSRQYEAVVGGSSLDVKVERIGQPGEICRYRVQLGEEEAVEVETARPAQDVLSLLIDTEIWEAGMTDTEDGFTVEVVGIHHDVAIIDPKTKALRMARGGGEDHVTVQMPGRIVRVMVNEGDVVEEGQTLMVVEAMKMENEMKSPRAGVVKRICMELNELVEAKAVLLELE
jgi:biotin carboxyl carrier protein